MPRTPTSPGGNVKRDRTLKPMEFPDAPSGFVHLYNYKEPLMKFKQGFGFEGVLLMDGNTGKVQCHFCGEWFLSLSYHIHKKHNMRAAEYKHAVGLAPKSALISEMTREKLIASGMEIRQKNLRPGGKKTPEEIEKIREGLRRWGSSRETQNKMNRCPEQLLERLRKRAEELGRTPVTRDITFEDTLVKVFGSYRRACELAGLKPNAKGYPPPHPLIWSREKIIESVKAFHAQYGRTPKHSDLIRHLVSPSWTCFRKQFGTDAPLRKAAEAAGLDYKQQV